MTDPIQALLDNTPPINFDLSDWDDGYISGLSDAQNALANHAVVELPKPRIMTDEHHAHLDDGAGPEIWTGSLNEWYVQDDVIVNDFGRSYSSGTLRREAAAMLATASPSTRRGTDERR